MRALMSLLFIVLVVAIYLQGAPVDSTTPTPTTAPSPPPRTPTGPTRAPTPQLPIPNTGAFPTPMPTATPVSARTDDVDGIFRSATKFFASFGRLLGSGLATAANEPNEAFQTIVGFVMLVVMVLAFVGLRTVLALTHVVSRFGG